MRHLDGNRAAQVIVMCEINSTKAAFAQDFLDPIAADSRWESDHDGCRSAGRCIVCGRLRGGRLAHGARSRRELGRRGNRRSILLQTEPMSAKKTIEISCSFSTLLG